MNDLKQHIEKLQKEVDELKKRNNLSDSPKNISCRNVLIVRLLTEIEDLKQLIASSDRSALKGLIDLLDEVSNPDVIVISSAMKDIASKLLKSINIGEQGD